MTARQRLRRGLAGGLAALATIAASPRGGDSAPYGSHARVDADPRGDPADALTVYVVYNGFHSDLEVPTAWLARGDGPSAAAVGALAPRRWTALGWGDAAFYQGHGFGVARAFGLARAALWPVNAAVVHLGGDDDPLAAGPGWRALRLTLSAAGAERLRRRLDLSFALRDGRPIATTPTAPPPADPPAALFFASGENAWLFHVCNSWTGELLHAAGTPVTPALDLTTAGLAADLRWRAGAVPVTTR